MFDRRDFLRRSLGLMLAAPTLDALCRTAVAVARTPEASLFAASLRRETHILDVVDGPAFIDSWDVRTETPAGRRRSLPVNCRVYWGDDPRRVFMDWMMNADWCGFRHQSPWGCGLIVPAGHSVCLAAETDQEGVEMAGAFYPRPLPSF